MRRQTSVHPRHATLALALPCILAAAYAQTTTSPLFTEGVEALMRADYPAAEQKLKAELRAHPANAEALSFLGVALDSQKKFAEADATHKRALALAPASNSVLDKYGSHLLLTGDETAAQATFVRALKLNAADGYANLQLAGIALRRRNGPEALDYLNRLSAAQQAAPEVAMDRLVALELSGSHTDAATVSATYRTDPAWTAAAGRALADAGELTAAERLLESAVAASPANFALSYGLGAVASKAGHFANAAEALEKAIALQPKNVDALYALAYADDALGRAELALELLRQAAHLAPQRPDVRKSLAIAAGNRADYKEAAEAWTAYVQLAPDDDLGRRERGFANAHIGKTEAGLVDLRWYCDRHPDDAEGFYELGIGESARNPMSGMASFDKALALKPDFAAARSARGALYYRQGKPENALPDLERAAALEPDNVVIQDRLGQVYAALDRPRDALRSFRRAAQMAPGNYQAQFHLANALAEAGETNESDAILERIRNWPVRKDLSTTGPLDERNSAPRR